MPFEPGIFFNLPEAAYHADPALGSSSLKALLRGPTEYWVDSHLNPDKPSDEGSEREARHRIFGRAVHKLVLEGQQAFERCYMPAPSGPDLLVTDAHLAEWLTARGETKLPRSKADKARLARSIDPRVRILDDIRDQAARDAITILDEPDFRCIQTAAGLIAAHPDLTDAFSGGMAEVSIFWTEDVCGTPVRCKARFDYLKLRGIGDLKSIGNTKGLPFAEACVAQIAAYRYDLQAAHYLRARAVLPALVAAGAVQGDHDPDWLSKVAAAEEYGWAWVFFHSGGAPLVWAASLSPGSAILEAADEDRAQALRRFARFSGQFAPDEPWIEHAPMTELDIDDMPVWFTRRQLERELAD